MRPFLPSTPQLSAIPRHIPDSSRLQTLPCLGPITHIPCQGLIYRFRLLRLLLPSWHVRGLFLIGMPPLRATVARRRLCTMTKMRLTIFLKTLRPPFIVHYDERQPICGPGSFPIFSGARLSVERGP